MSPGRIFFAGLVHKQSPAAAEYLFTPDANGILADRYEELTVEEIARIEQLGAETNVWHGTGRYCLDDNRQVQPVLDKIFSDGALQPKTDNFNVESGPIESISLSPSRMYARTYADLYRDAAFDEQSPRHISAREWAQFYTAGVVTRAVLRAAIDPSMPITRNRRQRLLEQHGVDERFMNFQHWSSRFRTDDRGWFDTLELGSDIDGNFGVLFGLAVPHSELIRDKLPSYLSVHEARSYDPLPLSRVTHIQAPEYAMQALEDLMQQHRVELPIVSIENAEAVAVHKPLSAIV